MTINAGSYMRKSFGCEAIQVTVENMHEVAIWCGGLIKDARDLPRWTGDKAASYIEVPIVPSKTRTFKPNQAFAGCWVLHTDQGWIVYSRKGFPMAFNKTDENKYLKVLKLVQEAMSRQDVATYHQNSHEVDGLDEEITHQIFELL